jgi:DNA gyrase/topoisomerase IV subunit A
MGVKAMQLNDKTGLMVAQLAVREDEDVLLMTDDGTIIRMAAADIRETGRNAQGVRLMRIAEGTKIVPWRAPSRSRRTRPPRMIGRGGRGISREDQT